MKVESAFSKGILIHALHCSAIICSSNFFTGIRTPLTHTHASSKMFHTATTITAIFLFSLLQIIYAIPFTPGGNVSTTCFCNTPSTGRFCGKRTAVDLGGYLSGTCEEEWVWECAGWVGIGASLLVNCGECVVKGVEGEGDAVGRVMGEDICNE